MTWDTLLILRGTKGIHLDHVGTLRPSKSYGWWGGGVVVAHRILVTSQEAKFLFSLFGALGFGLGLGLGLVNFLWATQSTPPHYYF